MKCNKIIEFSRDGGRQFIMSLNKAWQKTKEKDKYDKVWEIIKKKNHWCFLCFFFYFHNV